MNLRALLAGMGLAPAVFLLWLNSAPSSSHEGTAAVPPGTPASQVVRLLAEDGQIRSTRWFRLLLRFSGTDRRLRAGVYKVEKGTSAWGIVRLLSSGRGITIKVTIPEGWTADKIADRLEALGVCGRDPFLAAVSSTAAEGFLFPETYEFPPYLAPAQVRGIMVDHFEETWKSLVPGGSLSGPVQIGGRPWTVLEVVTLASIVEREGGRPEELPLIAAVYHNRLTKRMRLEADPTVLYALGRWKERLLYRDLEVDSPYNTYRRSGLPPGPIGNPGRLALQAVLAPAPVPFLYFVADDAGGHLFAVTYSEHLKNVRDRNRRLRRAPPSR